MGTAPDYYAMGLWFSFFFYLVGGIVLVFSYNYVIAQHYEKKREKKYHGKGITITGVSKDLVPEKNGGK